MKDYQSNQKPNPDEKSSEQEKFVTRQNEYSGIADGSYPNSSPICIPVRPSGLIKKTQE